MSALTTAPIGPIIDHFFAHGQHGAPGADAAVEALDDTEYQRLLTSRTGYAALYGLMKDLPLAVSRDTGRLLYMLARTMGARSIVEFGTSFGISTLHLAAALQDLGGAGRIITTEFEPSKIARARATFAQAGVSDLIDLREGDALRTLARDLPERIDLLLLDGAKSLYPDILALVEPHFRPGAMVLADNADMCPGFLEKLRAPGSLYLCLPFGPDVELAIFV